MKHTIFKAVIHENRHSSSGTLKEDGFKEINNATAFKTFTSA